VEREERKKIARHNRRIIRARKLVIRIASEGRNHLLASVAVI
jgi:hypothetical protein